MVGFGPRCAGCRQHLVPGALRAPPQLGERVLSRGPWWTRRLRAVSPRGRLRVHGGGPSRAIGKRGRQWWMWFGCGSTWGLIYSSAAALNEFLTVPNEPRCRDLFEISPWFVGLCVRRRIRWKYVCRESLSCCL